MLRPGVAGAMSTSLPEATKRKLPTRRLRVYSGNLDGTHEALMACHSYAEFKAATRISREYGGETVSADYVAKAMSEPGMVFKRAMSGPGTQEWTVHRRTTKA